MRIVIAGASEEGLHLARTLSERGHEVVLIDRNRAALALAEESLDVMTLVGDATHRSVLAAGQISGVRGFVALTDFDADNMLAAALAKTMGAQVVVARVDTSGFYQTPAAIEAGVLGVDVTFCAARLATTSLISAVMRVHNPFVQTFTADAIRVALLNVPEGSVVLGKPLEALEGTEHVRAAALVRDGFMRGRGQVAELAVGDQVLVAGPAVEVLDVWRRVQREHARQRTLVVGGGRTGAQLASILGARIGRVELVEKDRERAEALAGELQDITILSGDARSATFLQDQQIDTVDYLLAVTGDDEVNLLVSLLGRKNGVKHTFTLLHRPGYAELYAELGIEGAIGTYDLAARTIADAIAPPGLVRSLSLPGTGYAVTEWRLPRRPALLEGGRELTLGEVPLPPGVFLLALGLGPTVVPTRGAHALRGSETLLLACPRREVKSLGSTLGRLLREGAS